jgi:hypothetical protein
LPALLRIAEYFVGFIDLLELILTLAVSEVEVGMILSCEVPIGLADKIVGCSPPQSQHLVVIFVFDPHSFKKAGGIGSNA